MAELELTEQKQEARKLWGSGDYPAIATMIEGVGRLAVERGGVSAEDKVLDVACGAGNATIPAAQRGAEVTGLDLTPKLLEAGRAAAADAGVEIDWIEGDAEDLPFGEESFDVVLSVFGCMFAPDHRAAAREIARVLRPGGGIAICSWTPEGATGRFFETLGGRMPPPPEGFQPPVLWAARTTSASSSMEAGSSSPSIARRSTSSSIPGRRCSTSSARSWGRSSPPSSCSSRRGSSRRCAATCWPCWTS